MSDFDIKWHHEDLERFERALQSEARLEILFGSVAQELAKAYHKRLVQATPRDTGNLKAGWSRGDNLAFRVQQKGHDYIVEFTNDVEYACAVNNGHLSYNQYSGKSRDVNTSKGMPYEVHNRRKVRSPDSRFQAEYMTGMDAFFVYGRFFVEKTILNFEKGGTYNAAAIDRLLKKWWDDCLA